MSPWSDLNQVIDAIGKDSKAVAESIALLQSTIEGLSQQLDVLASLSQYGSYSIVQCFASVSTSGGTLLFCFPSPPPGHKIQVVEHQIEVRTIHQVTLKVYAGPLISLTNSNQISSQPNIAGGTYSIPELSLDILNSDNLFSLSMTVDCPLDSELAVRGQIEYRFISI